MRNNKIILVKYGLSLLATGLACIFWASAEMWTLSIPLFSLSSLLLYKKSDYEIPSKTGIFLAFAIVVFHFASVSRGWNEILNKKWGQFVYRPHVAVAVWLIWTLLWWQSLNRDLQEHCDKNKNESTNS